MTEEVNRVKEIGEQIGYGNLMSIASALWRKSAKENNYPVSGVFIPTCPSFIKEDLQDLDKESRKHYDSMVE